MICIGHDSIQSYFSIKKEFWKYLLWCFESTTCWLNHVIGWFEPQIKIENKIKNTHFEILKSQLADLTWFGKVESSQKTPTGVWAQFGFYCWSSLKNHRFCLISFNSAQNLLLNSTPHANTIAAATVDVLWQSIHSILKADVSHTILMIVLQRNSIDVTSSTLIK